MSGRVNNRLPAGATVTIWMVYSSCAMGTFLEVACTNKVQAEAALRWYKENSHGNEHHWIREIETQPHEV